MESRKNVGNAVILILQPLLLNAVSILSTAYIIRVLGPTGFGQWAVSATLAAVALMLASPGLRPIFVRSLAQKPETAGEILAEQLGLRMILACFSGGLGILACFLLGYPPVVMGCIAVAAVGVLLTTASNVLSDVLRGLENLKVYAGVNLVAGLSLTAVSVIVVSAGGGPVGLAVAYACGPLVSLALLFSIVRKHHCPVSFRWAPARFWEMLKQARVLASEMLLGTVHDRAEQLLLPKLTGITEFGFFAAATLPADRLIIVPDGVTTAYFPAISRQQEEDPSQVGRHVTQLTVISIVTCLPLALLVYFLAPWLSTVLFPKSPQICRDIMSITIWSLPLLGLSYPMGCALQATGNYNQSARRSIAAMCCSLAVSVFLVSRYGLTGACWAWVARPGIAAAFQLPLFVRTFSSAVSHVPVVRIAACGVLMAAALHFSRMIPVHGFLGIAFGAMAGILAYVAALLLFKVFGTRSLLALLPGRA